MGERRINLPVLESAPAGDGPWRGLDALEDPAIEQAWREGEFPALAEPEGMDRRLFLRLMAASAAMAGVGGCDRQPPERIVPRVRDERNFDQGNPRAFASAVTRGGSGLGVVVSTREGRPVKVEGNPLHPASLGGTDIFAQAELLTLYDPQRSRSVLHERRVSTWDRFGAEMSRELARLAERGGRGLRVLTGKSSSPTFLSRLGELLERLPEAQWHVHEPADMSLADGAGRLAWGRPLEPVYDFAAADVVVALDADFLCTSAGAVRYSRDFADRRKVRSGDEPRMSRLYAVEPSPSLTGAAADHRLPTTPGEVSAVARLVARELGLDVPGRPAERLTERQRHWARQCAVDLRRAGGRALVVPGAALEDADAALALAMNERLGALGRTVHAIEPQTHPASVEPEGLASLVEAMHAGEVELLVILGSDPVFTAPGHLEFAEALGRVQTTAHVGLFAGATGPLCDWHVPLAHEFERWGDCRAHDGTASVIQPMLRPLYGGRSPLEVIALLRGEPLAEPLEMLREHWREQWGASGFERRWHETLRRGVVADSAATNLSPRIRHRRIREALERAAGDETPAEARPSAGEGEPGRINELTFVPDPTIWDGRYRHHAWLQELPKPLSKLVWDNALLLNPGDARALRLEAGDVVRVRSRDRTIEAAAWPMPGQAAGVATISLGYRGPAGEGEGAANGFDAYPLRREERPWRLGGVSIEPTGRRYPLATTQHHGAMTGRDHYRHATLAEFAADPHRAAHPEGKQVHLSLLPEGRWEGRQWGMAIDLTACLGCGVCTIACQAENNIPVVGKEQVRVGREMHWIRVDRYFEGDAADPAFGHQPVPCMHCEKAPCEVVCPVGATIHSHDGLNEMTYNRCIGTRYCSNNCPYKVRRFNFFGYAQRAEQPAELARNPEVTVRSRGIMEKCTYCVQRIRRSEIEADLEDRQLRDGELVTACQQACPTRAITFGDVNDPESEVSRWKAQPHDYAMLAHLNTQPRTTYLAAISNPNPDLRERSPSLGEAGSAIGSGAEGGSR